MHLNLRQFGVLFSVVLLMSGCQGENNEAANTKGMAGFKMPVSVIAAKKQKVTLTYTYPARITSMSQVDVMARVQGILIEKKFEEGAFVKKGDPLYLIDPKEYEVALNIAKAQYSSAEATLKNAKRNYERIKPLSIRNTISKKEYDNALSAYEVAQAQLNLAKAQVENAQLNLSYTDIKAPISGITSKKEQNIGALVGSSSTNTQLITITQLDPIYAEFSIPSSDIDKINRIIDGAKVTILNENKKPYSFEGTIDFFDKRINVESDTLALRAHFKNPKNELLPGAFVTLTLQSSSKDTYFIIPQTAVMQSPQGAFVYVVKEGKAMPNPIKLGEVHGTNWYVDGLNEGDQVIIDNLMKIRPNSDVAPKPLDTNATKAQ
ncbi:MAG: efflux RND transporter periplasmic adaptor subunit [Campylobacterales bacterium]|nr:efflux RND transporter periplasmic adaptor subunit [Campylobacterales bacterium]